MILRALIVALAAVGGWGWWQSHRVATLAEEAAHWRLEAETATARAEQAAHAHQVASEALKAEQERNRGFDEIRTTIEENDNEEPISDVIADTLRRLCATDPECNGAAKGAARTAPAMRGTGPAR